MTSMSLPTLTTVDDYYPLIPINKHDIDRELEVQAELLLRISESKTRAASRMHEAKDELATAESRVYMKIRESGVKYTADETKNKVQQDSKRYEAWKEYQAARHEYDRWEGLFESWKQRGFAINKLGDLFLGGYFTTASITGDKQQRNAEHQHNRQAIAKARTTAKAEESTPRRRLISTSTTK